MTTSLTSSTALKSGRMIRAAEWLAENAYIPPGTHRLLTAGGLALGLWGGREIMDVITARDNKTGIAIPREQVGEMLRPFHGVMAYNPYSDNASDRWRSVVDKLSPMVLGGLGAYFGSKAYIHYPTSFAHTASQTVLKKAAAGKFTLSNADALSNIRQGDTIRKVASPLFAIGSTAGTHVFGGLFPFTNSMSAQTFMSSIGRKLWLPGGGPINRFFGNRSASGKHVYSAMNDAAKWIEANVTKFDHSQMTQWATDEFVHKYARDALQVFPKATKADELAVASNIRKVIDEAYKHKGTPKLYESITNAEGLNGSHGLFDIGFENMLKDSGKRLEQATLGDNGPFTFFSRLIGSTAKEKEVWKGYAKHLNKQHGYTLNPDSFAADRVTLSPVHAGLAYGGIAAGVAGALSMGGITATRMNKRRADPAADAVEPSMDENAPSLGAHRQSEHEKSKYGNVVDWINGKPLDVMQWVSRAAINPPSMHRFMNAAYLSAALFGGMKFMNVLTGRNLQKIRGGDLSKSLVEVKDIWAPLRHVLKPLHNSLSYTPGSSAMKDRVRQAAHFIVPVGIGAFGTYTGSHMFFKDRITKLENPHTLEDYTDRIALEQSKPFAALTAVTSIFNTGSGIHLLPMFNYSSNLHNRYLLASGQQVSMPGLGKWWSGNAGLTPWGVKKSLHYTANYLAYNEDARPKELPNLVYSVLGKLYPHLPEDELLQKKREFMHAVNEVRDTYLVEGRVPHSKQAELAKTMKELMTGKGFEQMLLQIGLDPRDANLANNGMSGKIANVLGQKGDIKQLTNEYHQQFAERSANYRAVTPMDIVAGKAASAAVKSEAAASNDNGPHAADKAAPATAKISERTHKGRVTERSMDLPAMGA